MNDKSLKDNLGQNTESLDGQATQVVVESGAEIAAFLVSEVAESIIQAALATLGWELVKYSCDKPYVRPGAGVSVGYFVTARASDKEFSTYLTASTEKVDNTSAVLTFTDPEGIVQDPIYVWQFPHDPALPALAQATNTAAMREVWPERENIAARVVVYRPTRRAVVEYSENGVPFGFGKVMHPPKARDLLRRTQTVAQGSSPVPPIIYSNDDGLLVSAVAQGSPLSNTIAFDPDHAIGLIGKLEDALDALPDEVAQLDKHPSWTDRIDSYGGSAAELMPAYADDIHRVIAWVKSVVSAPGKPADVATHGDFFEANVLIDVDDTLTFIDLDHVGPGKRNDDWGCMLAHVSVLPFLLESQWVVAESDEPFRERLEKLNPGGMRCSYYPRSEEVLEAWCQYLEQRTDPVDLYARAAAVTLSMASNADVNQAPREAEARMRRVLWWMERAQGLESAQRLEAGR
ncbi:MAG: phosphotransferase [Actinomycetaceae bacterium]|nr:phosphotransferase [Actinomycetaceae bacterium]